MGLTVTKLLPAVVAQDMAGHQGFELQCIPPGSVTASRTGPASMVMQLKVDVSANSHCPLAPLSNATRPFRPDLFSCPQVSNGDHVFIGGCLERCQRDLGVHSSVPCGGQPPPTAARAADTAARQGGRQRLHQQRLLKGVYMCARAAPCFWRLSSQQISRSTKQG